MLMIGAALVSITLGTGCKKEQATNENYSAEAQDISQSEDVSTSVDNTVTQAFNSHSGSADGRYGYSTNGELSECSTVTWDSAASTCTIHFDHCNGRNGHTRDGNIIIHYQGGNYWTPGASWDATFDNFYIDDNKVTGTRHVVNNGPASNTCTWSITANLTFTRSNDGSTRTWTSTRTREITQGYGDTVCTNHIYKINGTATHADTQSGNSASLTFTNIIRDLSCAYITAGTIAVVPNNSRPNRSIDFGSGACDDLATVTKNGESRVIHLDGGHH